MYVITSVCVCVFAKNLSTTLRSMCMFVLTDMWTCVQAVASKAFETYLDLTAVRVSADFAEKLK